VDLVDEIDFVVVLAELVFRVHENQTFFSGHLGAAFEEGAGVAFHHFIVGGAHDALGYYLFFRDVLVVSGLGLGGGGDDGLGEAFVLTHSLGKLHAAYLAASGLVFAPCASGEVSADNHFHAEALAADSDGHHGVGRSEFPVGHNVGGGVEEVCGYFVQHLAFVGDAFGKDNVEGRDAVCGDHYQKVFAYGIDVAYFAVIHSGLTGKVEVGA
jgi:hypothetical protein